MTSEGHQSSLWKVAVAGALWMCGVPGVGLAGAAVPELPPGHWIEVPQSHLRSVAPAASPGGNLAKVIEAWSGGALDTKRNQLLVWGGGHSNYAGNEVYAFQLNDMRWRRLSDPSVADDSKAPGYPDGQPRSRHTYNYIEYVPAWDRLVSFGGSGPWPRGGGEFTREVSEFDFDRRTWITGARPRVPPGGSMIAAIARTDPSSGDVYFVPGARAALMRLDTRSEQWQGGWGRGYLTAHATAAIDPVRRLMVAVGKGTADGSGQIWLWDLSRPSAPINLEGRTTGDRSVEQAMAPGFVYHPPSRKFVAWIGGTDVYAFDPERREWRRVPAAIDNVIDPGPQSLRGTYGRFQYVESLDAFVLVNDVDQNVFLFRPDLGSTADIPQGAGGTPPGISLQASPSQVAAGEYAQISWSTTGADKCAADGGWSGQIPVAGLRSMIVPQGGAQYIVRCTGSGGTAEATASVAVPPSPAVVLRAEPAVVESGGTATVVWSAVMAAGCDASGDWHGPRATSGVERIANIQQASQFVLECDGEGGSQRAKAEVRLVEVKPLPTDLGSEAVSGSRGGLGGAGLITNGVLLALAASRRASQRRLRSPDATV